MERKRQLLAILAAVGLITLAVTGLIYAGVPSQNDSDNPRDITDELVDMVDPKDGDDTVLATINERNFTSRDARLGYELKLAENPSLIREEAIKASILHRVDEVLLASIAEQRGITGTEAEARVLMEREKAACRTNSEIQAMCRAYQERLGYNDPAIFWEATVAGYLKDVTRMKVVKALYDDYRQTREGAADNSDIPLLNLKILETERANATIIWKDTQMQRSYEEAQVARSNELNNTN